MDGGRIVQQGLDAQRARDSHSQGPGLSVAQAIAACNAVSSKGRSPGSAEGREIVRMGLRTAMYGRASVRTPGDSGRTARERWSRRSRNDDIDLRVQQKREEVEQNARNAFDTVNHCDSCRADPENCANKFPSWYAACFPGSDRETNRFVVPDSSLWGNPGCEFSAWADLCGDAPFIREASDEEALQVTSDSNGADGVNIELCSADFTEMLKTAVTFLIENSDIVTWATCLLYGSGYQSRIPEKLLQKSVFDGRLDITCDDGGSNHGVLRPCVVTTCAEPAEDGSCLPYLGLSFALFGVNICTEKIVVDTWLRLFASSDSAERLCGLIDLSSVLVHELAHVTLTFRSGDLAASQEDTLDETCSRAHLLQSIYQWAIYQRYPQALRATCCSQREDPFMDSEVLGIPSACDVLG